MDLPATNRHTRNYHLKHSGVMYPANELVQNYSRKAVEYQIQENGQSDI